MKLVYKFPSAIHSTLSLNYLYKHFFILWNHVQGFFIHSHAMHACHWTPISAIINLFWSLYMTESLILGNCFIWKYLLLTSRSPNYILEMLQYKYISNAKNKQINRNLVIHFYIIYVSITHSFESVRQYSRHRYFSFPRLPLMSPISRFGDVLQLCRVLNLRAGLGTSVLKGERSRIPQPSRRVQLMHFIKG